MRYSVLCFILMLFFSCNSGHETSRKSVSPDMDELAGLNRYLVQKDREIIENYNERKNLKMTESATGLWFRILKEGSGVFFKDNDKIKFDYECSLIDGTKCYSSEILGPKEIILGKTELEAGLNEGLKMLKPGAEAIFVLPPYIAYGLLGDGNKIPPRSIIVYNITILRDI